MKVAQQLQEEYGYVWDEEEFDSSLEILTEIRRICIQKSEPSTATIGIKKWNSCIYAAILFLFNNNICFYFPFIWTGIFILSSIVSVSS